MQEHNAMMGTEQPKKPRRLKKGEIPFLGTQLQPIDSARSTLVIQTRLQDELAEAFLAFIKAQRFPPQYSDVMQEALRQFLISEKFLKPRPEASEVDAKTPPTK